MKTIENKIGQFLKIMVVMLIAFALSACPQDKANNDKTPPNDSPTQNDQTDNKNNQNENSGGETNNSTDTTAPIASVSVAGGTYTGAQHLVLNCNDSNGSGCKSIHYTTDGTEPTKSSAIFNSEIVVDAGVTTLKFFAEDNAGNSSAVVTEIYTIDNAVSGGTSIFTIAKISAQESQLAIDSNGTIHYMYEVRSTNSTLEYGQCSSNCGEASSWHFIELVTTQGFSSYKPKMVIDAFNRVHVVYNANWLVSDTYPVYLICEQNCLESANWNGIELTDLKGLWSTYRSSPLVVDSNGRVYLIQGTGGGTEALLSCASNCTNKDDWTFSQFGIEFTRASMVAVGQTIHMIVDNSKEALIYLTCSTGCETLTNWTVSGPLFLQDGSEQVLLTANENGRLVLGYNQGFIGSQYPEDVTQFNYHQFLWVCDQNCGEYASWQLQADFGKVTNDDGISIFAQGDALVMAIARSSLDIWVCENDCANPQSWASVVADSNELMNQVFEAAEFFGCTDSSSGAPVKPWQAFWYADEPQLAVTASGSVVIAHNPYVLRSCSPSSQITRLGSTGRLIYIQ